MTQYIPLALCFLVLAFAVLVHLQSLRWIRGMAKADAEISRELRLIIHDMISMNPYIEEQLQVALHQLDDWEKRMEKVRMSAFLGRKPKV